ncbi:MAG: 1-acyl-sn-glycerol-3-phosphate acyltransferase [Rhodobacteraceae bacterium]|nr:1-acyl-sn-glycerol-3-phosphate acyltransferase [Paracoccaceae bacterium]MBR9822055.1 1-acyl-sn-glycerol-3-phosphate acyltransferase [Paracoccaceae bacterium]
MATWTSPEAPAETPVSTAGKLIAALRVLPLALILLLCLLALLLVRLVEAPLCGLRRPVTPIFQQAVARAFFVCAGMRLKVTGRPMRGAGAMVSNHVSWLDIFALSAPGAVFFVSKSEVRGWPGIGHLARATGTLFIDRRRGEAKRQRDLLLERLSAGQRLHFFPEGTSTDGKRVLPFKTSLFDVFFDPSLPQDMQVQPVTLIYRAPEGAEPRFYGWWGEMGFGASFLKVMAARPQGAVEVIYHTPLRMADFPNRKTLAAACERTIREAMPWDWQQAG